MAALLFIAGDQREMLPHSRVMIHDPLIGGDVFGEDDGSLIGCSVVRC